MTVRPRCPLVRHRRLLCCLALSLALAACGGRPERIDPAALEKVQTLISDSHYQEAEAQGRALLEQTEARSGRESLQAAGVIDLLVEAMRRGGKARDPEAFRFARRAVAIKEERLGDAHPEVGKSVKLLGTLYDLSDDFEEAGRLYRRAHTIQKSTLGEEDLETVKTLNNIGGIHLKRGEYSRARSIYEEVLRLREKALGSEHADVAKALDNVGNVTRVIGEYATARSAFERALAIRRNVLPSEHADLGSNLDNLANLLYVMGDYASARPLYEQALAIRVRSLGSDHPDVATTHNNLANLLLDSAGRDDAKRHYEQALRIREKVFGRESLDVASTLFSLAEWHREGRDYARARPLYEEALSIGERILGEDDVLVASFVQGLAQLRFEEKDLAAAGPLYDRILRITENALGPDHPEVGRALANLAVFRARTGGTGAALSAALRSEAIGRNHVRLTARSLSEREALRYAAVRVRALDLAIELVVKGVDPASRGKMYDSLVRSRGLVLDEMSARHRTVGEAGDPEVARLANDLRDRRTRLAALMVRGRGEDSPARFRGLLDAARREAEEAERALAARSAAFRRQQEHRQIGLEQVARALPPDSALVGLARYHDRGAPAYVAFVMQAGETAPAVVPLGTAAAIDSAFDGWAREAARGVADESRSPVEAEAAYRSAATVLRRAVWDRLASGLTGAKLIFVVPDGLLNLVSFNTLPDTAGGYLVEGAPRLHYISAERDLILGRVEGSRGSGLLAIGGPAFDEASLFAGLRAKSAPSGSDPAASTAADTRPAAGETRGADYRGERPACADFRSIVFKSLTKTEREVRDITELWRRMGGPVEQLTGVEASETAFKREAPGRLVIHLATHGFFMGGRCASALESSRGAGGLKIEESPDEETAGENPLLLSGLALAGANHRQKAAPGEDDGILTAEEIAAMDLTGTQWAVLSACDTGVGEIQAGEGVFGLRRAFQVAGVGTVIMSLWSVQDQATWEWMKNLHTGRLEGLSTAEAMRRASVEMIGARRRSGASTHPFYWGAFVASGDWR